MTSMLAKAPRRTMTYVNKHILRIFFSVFPQRISFLHLSWWQVQQHRCRNDAALLDVHQKEPATAVLCWWQAL